MYSGIRCIHFWIRNKIQHNYEQYADGKLSRESFLLEKKRHEEELGRLESRMNEMKKEQAVQRESGRQEKKRASQLAGFAGQMELTKEIKEKLIDEVKVYSDNRIEICWKFEAGFSDVDTIHMCGQMPHMWGRCKIKFF